MSHPLDNPVWAALSGRQQHFTQGTEAVKYFPADVAPFIAMNHWGEDQWPVLFRDMPAGRSFSVLVNDAITLPPAIEVTFSLPLYQLVCPALIPYSKPGIVIRDLVDGDIQQMLSLTAATKPGPFFQRTIEFGNYTGICDGDELLAMAGERLQVNGFTEASAICTKPGHNGKGYASLLLSAVAEKIIAAGDTPFLHVKQDNEAALAVYKKLGFAIRRETYFAVFRKK